MRAKELRAVGMVCFLLYWAKEYVAMELVSSTVDRDRAFQSFLQKGLLEVPPALLEDGFLARAKSSFEKQLEEFFRFLDDEAFAEKFHKAIGIGDPKDYLFRLYQMGSDDFVLTSLRFKGLDRNKPFIEIVQLTMDLPSFISGHRAEVGEVYSLFAPATIRTHSFTTSLPESSEIDDFYVLAKLRDIRPPSQPTTIEKAIDLSWYEDYVTSYNDLEINRNEVVACVETRESLQRSLDEGLLYCLRIDGKWAGVMGAVRLSQWYFDGYYIFEKVIAKEYRGKGLSAKLESTFCQRLPNPDGTLVVYGQIHEVNEPSLRSAKSIGREVVGCNFFFPL